MSEPSAKSRWWRSLRFTIGVLFAIMVILSTGVILTLSRSFAERNMDKVSGDLMAQVTQRAQDRVASFLGQAKRAIEVSVGAVELGLLDPDDPDQLERQFSTLMRSSPDVTSLHHSDTSGRFVMVKREDDLSLTTRVVRVDSSGQRATFVRRTISAEAEEGFVQVHPEGGCFDPVGRPWYDEAQGSSRMSWVAPYVFDSDKRLGVTASIRDRPGVFQGVFAADVSLAHLSTFLASLKIAQGGEAFLVDERGRLIASPHSEDLLDTQRKWQLKPVRDCTRQYLRDFARLPAIEHSIESGLESSVPGRVADSSYPRLGEISSVSFYGVNWRLIVLVPEEDFLGEIEDERRRQLGVALLFGFMILIASLLVARWISRSLLPLADECEKLRSLDLTGSRLSSPFQEIDEVLHSFENMKTGLRAFDKYMPSELVRTLLATGKEAELGAEERELTILFTDIAGFTSISEQLEPMTLARHLGRYHGELTRVIESHHGTVVQYVGDALVALWNAPLEVQDHAVQACAAALACQSTLEQLARDAPMFPTRIGIHTARVAVGNFGSPDRLIYSSIGDGMNVASRLEGTNKVYGTQVIVSDDTLERVDRRFETRRLDLVVVKGRTGPIAIHELLGEKGGVPAEVIQSRDLYEKGLDCYVMRDWDSAIEHLDAAGELRNDPATSILSARCEEYRKKPPPDDWDGSHFMETK